MVAQFTGFGFPRGVKGQPMREMVIQLAADRVTAWLDGLQPAVAVVLGSGLGNLVDEVAEPIRLPVTEVPGFHPTTVPGHTGELVAGLIGGVPVIIQSGRSHMYEGLDAFEASLPVRVFAECGVGTLVVTNAAGGVNGELEVGSLMVISDHLNLTGRNPSIGETLSGEVRFQEMGSAYDPRLRQLATSVADRLGLVANEGVYAGVLGPSFETPAEVKMLEHLGADAVGMSTVVEVLAARARGLSCLGLSLITNSAASDEAAPLSHEEVLLAAESNGGAARMTELVREVIAQAGQSD